MIFVTVGTHEQQFNRLIEYVDNLVKKGSITEKVIIQTGFSTYEPKYCEWSNLFSFSEMEKNVADAHIVITHGGPSSFILPLQIGKIPIVVPRKYEFKEHVNNHQMNFCKAVEERMGIIIVIDDIENLEATIRDYDDKIKGMNGELKSNNSVFCEKFEKLVDEML